MLVAAATAARAQECPDGLEGPECSMCVGGTALGDQVCVNITDYASAFCYSNHTWAEGSTQKTYDCTTEASERQLAGGRGGRAGAPCVRVCACNTRQSCVLLDWRIIKHWDNCRARSLLTQ
jgi:hypothetical protein